MAHDHLPPLRALLPFSLGNLLFAVYACGAPSGVPMTPSSAGPLTSAPAPDARSSAPTTGSRPGFAWPNGAGAAVSLTYDDAIPTDLDVAGPALDRHGLHGTFFVTGTSPELAKRADAWRALARGGHELASHTMFHPCDRLHDFVKKGFALEDYDLERMRRELKDSVALLQSLGADYPPHTFAYPCGQTWVGEGHTSYIPLAEELFRASRGVGSTIADPWTEPLGNVSGVMGDAKTGAALIALVEAAVAKSGWMVFVFHGVGGDYLTVDQGAHDELLRYLETHRKDIWTDTFGAVAAAVAAARGR